MASAPSVRERALRDPQYVAGMYKVAQADPAFRRFMGRALNSLFPAKDWKPFNGNSGAAA
jgi:hypothetical protein